MNCNGSDIAPRIQIWCQDQLRVFKSNKTLALKSHRNFFGQNSRHSGANKYTERFYLNPPGQQRIRDSRIGNHNAVWATIGNQIVSPSN